MEYSRRDAMDGVDDLITEESFGHLLLMHAQVSVFFLSCLESDQD